MDLLKRESWYELAQKLDWRFGSVRPDEVYPEAMSGLGRVPLEAWRAWQEPYRVTYREYVENQREKDAGVYAIKAGLAKANLIDRLEPGWKSILKAHYGAIALGEYVAAIGEAHMARFGADSAWRNMATFGMLDEMRHGQIQLFFPHEFVSRDRQFDWAHKAYSTQEWGSIAARSLFDDMFAAATALETAIQLTFTFETGFTNLQFLGMAADAMGIGDYTFSNLLSSIQTDESRHAQIGAPTLAILLEHDRERAQYLIDKMFWRAWRIFALLTGISMDYYTPLEHRRMSFKEFMQEWIVDQFLGNIRDLGLDVPWYWDRFLYELDHAQHALHLGVYFWRPTVWWPTPSGMKPAEREWLNAKYPNWEAHWGRHWDVIIANYLNGHPEKVLPETLPVVCAIDQLPICEPDRRTGKVQPRVLSYRGKKYHFCSEVCQWIFEQEPDRYAGQKTIVDRFLEGMIQPATLEGALRYMGFEHPEEMGTDPENGQWAEAYRAMAKVV
jgi:toluene monooxygenase system protein A